MSKRKASADGLTSPAGAKQPRAAGTGSAASVAVPPSHAASAASSIASGSASPHTHTTHHAMSDDEEDHADEEDEEDDALDPDDASDDRDDDEDEDEDSGDDVATYGDDGEGTVADVAPHAGLRWMYAESASLDSAAQARLWQHIRTLDRAERAAGVPRTMDVEHARRAIANTNNDFCITMWTESDAGRGTLGGGLAIGGGHKTYEGFLFGGERVRSASAGSHSLTINVDCVFARHGRGEPLLKVLLFADSDGLRARFSGKRVTFKLRSVAPCVQFYQRFHFQARGRDREGLTRMRTKPKSFPVFDGQSAVAATSAPPAAIGPATGGSSAANQWAARAAALAQQVEAANKEAADALAAAAESAAEAALANRERAIVASYNRELLRKVAAAEQQAADARAEAASALKRKAAAKEQVAKLERSAAKTAAALREATSSLAHAESKLKRYKAERRASDAALKEAESDAAEALEEAEECQDALEQEEAQNRRLRKKVARAKEEAAEAIDRGRAANKQAKTAAAAAHVKRRK